MFDPFATLGLERRFELDATVLETRYRELQRVLHPDRHSGGSASERRMSLSRAMEVNEAYRTLKDELRRAEALLALQGGAGDAHEAPPAGHGGEGAADPEFLMEVLELREALGEAKDAGDLARVRALAMRVDAMQRAAHDALVRAFTSAGVTPDAAVLAEAARLVGRLKYYRRFFDEVSAIEDNASPATGAAS